MKAVVKFERLLNFKKKSIDGFELKNS